MAIIFSPVTQDVIQGPFKPRPRHAFVMVHSAEHVSAVERRLHEVVGEELERRNFTPLKATDVSGTADYLEKIMGLIRGCGFGVAIFSEFTPAPTMANIFFEVGMCHVFGKPVLLTKTESATTPSDFVRTEWVSLRVGREDRFRSDLGRALASIEEAGAYYRVMAEVALQAEEVDHELVFERLRQAVLISGDEEARSMMVGIPAALDGRSGDRTMAASKKRLREDVQHFLKQLGAP